MTFTVLLRVRKRIRNERTVVQINFVISLLLFQMLVLFNDTAITNRRACTMMAVMTHFTILSSGEWRTFEATT